jgi:hypothetical protein
VTSRSSPRPSMPSSTATSKSILYLGCCSCNAPKLHRNSDGGRCLAPARRGCR